MSEVEQDHIVDAYTFELGKVEVQGVVERMVGRLFLVAEELALRVSYGLGLSDPGEPPGPTEPVAPDASGGLDASPALAMVTEDTFPVDGRVVHILANDGADLTGIRTLRDSLYDAGAVAHVIATHKGEITGRRKPTSSPSTGRSSPRARPRPTPSWSPVGQIWPRTRRPSPTCRAPTATTSRSVPGVTAPSSSPLPGPGSRTRVW